jgi:hypothetical protein
MHLGRYENGVRLSRVLCETEHSYLSLRITLDNITSVSLGHSTISTSAINQGGGLSTVSSQPVGPDTLHCIETEA